MGKASTPQEGPHTPLPPPSAAAATGEPPPRPSGAHALAGGPPLVLLSALCSARFDCTAPVTITVGGGPPSPLPAQKGPSLQIVTVTNAFWANLLNVPYHHRCCGRGLVAFRRQHVDLTLPKNQNPVAQTCVYIEMKAGSSVRRSGGCGVVCVGGKGQARKDSKKRAVYIQPVGPARARRQRMGKAVEEGKQQGHAHTTLYPLSAQLLFLLHYSLLC